MTTEGNKRMLALSCIVADLKAENMELEQRVHQLVDDYNEVARQLNGNEKRKDEDPARQTLGGMMQMRDHCDKLEVENNNLKTCLIAVSSFLRDKNLYMANGTLCSYGSGNPEVCPEYCKKCNSYLSTLKDVGVVCSRRLAEASVIFPDNE